MPILGLSISHSCSTNQNSTKIDGVQVLRKRNRRVAKKAGVLVVTRLLFECGIQLIGLPALQVALHQRLFALSTCRTAVSPFRIQHSQQLSMLHRHLLDGRFVSAPEPRLSPYALADVAILHVGRSFLKPH